MSTCAGRDDVFWGSFHRVPCQLRMDARLPGYSPTFILAGFISSTRISDPLMHVLSPLLRVLFLRV